MWSVSSLPIISSPVPPRLGLSQQQEKEAPDQSRMLRSDFGPMAPPPQARARAGSGAGAAAAAGSLTPVNAAVLRDAASGVGTVSVAPPSRASPQENLSSIMLAQMARVVLRIPAFCGLLQLLLLDINTRVEG